MKIPRYILRGFAGIFTILIAVFGMMNDPDDKKWAVRFALIAISAWTVEMFLVLRHQYLKSQADLSVAPKGKLKSEVQPSSVSKTVQREYTSDIINGIVWRWTWNRGRIKTYSAHCRVCDRSLNTHGPFADPGGLTVQHDCPEHPGLYTLVGTPSNPLFLVTATVSERITNGTWKLAEQRIAEARRTLLPSSLKGENEANVEQETEGKKTTESSPAKKDAIKLDQPASLPITPAVGLNPMLLPYSVRKWLREFLKAGEPQYTAQELMEIRIANGDRVVTPEQRDNLRAALIGFKGPLSVYVDDNDSEAEAFCEELVAILKGTEEKRIKISRLLINNPPQYGIILELKRKDTVPPHARMLYEALTNAGFSIEMVFKPYLSEYEAPRLVIGYGPRRQEAEQEAERIRDIRIKRLGPSRR